MPRRSQVRLSVGASSARKVVATGCAAPLLVVAGLLLWVIARLMYETVTERPFDFWGTFVPHLLVAAVFLLGAFVVGIVGYTRLAMIRYAGFLDRTMLAERFLFRKRWVDLATAAIYARHDPLRGGVDLLVARSPETGVEVELPVRQGANALPPAELTALADAITHGRARTGADDPAFATAHRLREMAASSVAQANTLPVPEP